MRLLKLEMTNNSCVLFGVQKMTIDTGLYGDSSDQLVGDVIHLDHVQILVHLFCHKIKP